MPIGLTRTPNSTRTGTILANAEEPSTIDLVQEAKIIENSSSFAKETTEESKDIGKTTDQIKEKPGIIPTEIIATTSGGTQASQGEITNPNDYRQNGRLLGWHAEWPEGWARSVVKDGLRWPWKGSKPPPL